MIIITCCGTLVAHCFVCFFVKRHKKINNDKACRKCKFEERAKSGKCLKWTEEDMLSATNEVNSGRMVWYSRV